MSDLLHFSAQPLDEIYDVGDNSRPDHKPEGLWVSVGEAWAEWCLAESYETGRLRHVARIALSESANILRLGTAAELRNFTARYKRPVAEYRGDVRIDWPRLQREFDGIIIDPYIWECRLARDTDWYYSWDVASGCIWKASAIATVDRHAIATLESQR